MTSNGSTEYDAQPRLHPTGRRKDRLLVRRGARWFDNRLGAAKGARTLLGKVFPDHWSFMIGELALYAFVVLLLTGTYLTFFFNPSQKVVTYHGSYKALQGVQMTQAYKSAIDISFDVRAGLVMRQIHHWAALLFLAAIVVHLMRIFFTGAFRRPREINWIIGVILLILAIFNGFAGYSLLDDQLSGTGLRIAYSIALSIPVAGTWLASLLFGGEFPGPDIINRLYVIHILLIPALIVGLLVAHLGIIVRQKHTQFRGKGRREDNVVGERVWPAYAAKALGLFFITGALLCGLGGLAQINPIWLYGPFDPAEVSSASQPDWYMGWLDGALRIMPNFEIRAFGYEIPNPFFPAVLLAGITFALLFAWPFLEARFTGDHVDHHLLDRPRDRPLRTALGVATLTFYAVLTLVSSSDVLSTTFGLSVNAVVRSAQILLIVLPLVFGRIAYVLCKELTARDAPVTPTEMSTPVEPEPPDREPDREPVATPVGGSVD
jgi:ubiquinol-cytochrome c reductase cytochrome b subunit